jgi:hypothetical protein
MDSHDTADLKSSVAQDSASSTAQSESRLAYATLTAPVTVENPASSIEWSNEGTAASKPTSALSLSAGPPPQHGNLPLRSGQQYESVVHRTSYINMEGDPDSSSDESTPDDLPIRHHERPRVISGEHCDSGRQSTTESRAAQDLYHRALYPLCHFAFPSHKCQLHHRESPRSDPGREEVLFPVSAPATCDLGELWVSEYVPPSTPTSTGLTASQLLSYSRPNFAPSPADYSEQLRLVAEQQQRRQAAERASYSVLPRSHLPSDGSHQVAMGRLEMVNRHVSVPCGSDGEVSEENYNRKRKRE